MVHKEKNVIVRVSQLLTKRGCACTSKYTIIYIRFIAIQKYKETLRRCKARKPKKHHNVGLLYLTIQSLEQMLHGKRISKFTGEDL